MGGAHGLWREAGMALTQSRGRTLQRQGLLTHYQEDLSPLRAVLAFLSGVLWGDEGTELDKIEHPRPLPELIVLDSNVSVGIEI